ncbi:MAG TPA: VOC family protein [Acidimicrobiales bacterium]
MPTRLDSVVFDARDPAGLARFWSVATGWPISHEATDEVVVEPTEDASGAATEPGLPLVFGRVDDPKVAKNRVHVDLNSRSPGDQEQTVDRLLAAGARHVDIGQGDRTWVVLADPEGNELCVLAPDDAYARTGAIAAVVVDVPDPGRLAPFWRGATGYEVVLVDDDGDVRLGPPDGPGPYLDLLGVADEKVAKNRVHLDVAPYADDDQAAEVERLLSLGATRVDIGQGEQTWVVLADPAGNELCVLSPRGTAP